MYSWSGRANIMWRKFSAKERERCGWMIGSPIDVLYEMAAIVGILATRRIAER